MKNLVIVCVLAGLAIVCGAVFYISDLQSDLAAAENSLAIANDSNEKLIKEREQNEETTRKQLENEQKLREQANAKAKQLQQALSNSECANVRLPLDVLNRLRETSTDY